MEPPNKAHQVRPVERGKGVLVYGALVVLAACISLQPTKEPPASPSAVDRGNGPYLVSRPPAGVPVYIVELRPAFDQWVYADSIAKRTGGKVGYIYSSFHAFTLHSVAEKDIARVPEMREVLRVEKSISMKVD